jgi:transcriptional regulator with XRE-family HTH domain
VIDRINLEEERLNRGLSLRAGAKRIGIGPDVLARAEEGNMPRPDSALKIADFYGYKVTDIWPIKDDPPPVVVGRVRKKASA